MQLAHLEDRYAQLRGPRLALHSLHKARPCAPVQGTPADPARSGRPRSESRDLCAAPYALTSPQCPSNVVFICHFQADQMLGSTGG